MAPNEVPAGTCSVPEALLGIEVRLSAELGRARLPLARLTTLGEGALVDLDRAPDAPVDVYVNGFHYGHASLLTVDGEWAIRLESVPAAALGKAPSGLSGSAD